MNGDVDRVPLVDLSRQYALLAEEIDEAVMGVLSSGMFILGPEVSAFEEEFAEYIGVSHAVGVGSGTDALFLTLKALGIGSGDEVVTTPFTFIATADTIANCGATPVFADIDPRTYNVDPDRVRERLTDRTKAIIAVHLFGQPADMRELLQIGDSRGLPVLEDCAQSVGARLDGRKAGSFGAASTFSFFPTKNLGGAGDGGMVCTDDGGLAGKVRMLRAHGSREKYKHEVLGYKSRLDAIQASLLRVKLRHLDRFNDERARIAAFYDDNLEGVETPYVAPGATHVYHQYTVRAGDRDALKQELGEVGIGSAVHYATPPHLQPCFENLGYGVGDFPKAENASRSVLSLPVFPGMTGKQRERVCEEINEILAR